MEITGTVSKIDTPINTGTFQKQTFELITNDNRKYILLVFNKLELLNNIKVGNRVKVLYNKKEKQIGEKFYSDNFVNFIQLENQVNKASERKELIYTEHKSIQSNGINVKNDIKGLHSQELYNYLESLENLPDEKRDEQMNIFWSSLTLEQEESLPISDEPIECFENLFPNYIPKLLAVNRI